MKQKITLIGFGTVAQGLCEILLSKRNELKKNYNYEFDIVAISDIKYGTVFNPSGLNIRNVLNDIQKNGKFTKNTYEWDAIETIKKSNANVVCELAYTNLVNGQPAINHCKTALSLKKHVVTSNKGPAVFAYKKLSSLAKKNGVKFLIEGTVMSGTPVLNLARGPLAGCRINSVKGILNGTTNFILTKMEEGLSYQNALEEAKKLGYAEADPTNDVEGLDAKAKVTILANVLMGINLKFDNVQCEGITKLTLNDIEEAKRKNSRWKLIASIEKNGDEIKASVKPELIPLTHPLAQVMGSTNAITFDTDLLGELTVIGKGAGKTETGFAILSDLLSIHLSKNKNLY
ncbi:homoserine dehydrogenase [Rosettibacter firmus]|uniref:homoserine dehydrogenase n=1 Tax=Rosettibacter firmus TaxID=3111522 RepID=UPI00336BE3B8